MTVEISNITFAYKKEPILKNVSTTIENGDFVAFVGPNGSGKSTLIRCLDGILSPQKGVISINDKNIHKIARNDLAKMIAYVPQSEITPINATVYDTILMGRKPYIGWYPTKNDHAVVIKIIKMLDLESISLSYLTELSGGQRQRVFIARALAQEPSVLLLDEPTANLDLTHTLEVLELLRELSKKQITIIVAIHDLNLAVKYCNSIVMLNKGEIFAKGGTEIMTTENIKKLYDVDVKVVTIEGQTLFITR